MIHKTFSCLFTRSFFNHTGLHAFTIIIIVPLLLVLACTPVHKGNVHQGIKGEKRAHDAIIRDGFENADINGSGYLENAEYSTFRQGPEMTRFLNQISEYHKSGALLFDEVDEDGNRRISLDEMLTTIQSMVP